MTHEEIVRYVQQLPNPERKALVKELIDLIDAPTEQPKRSLRDFRGVGAHLRDEDAQAYVDRLRDEWD